MSDDRNNDSIWALEKALVCKRLEIRRHTSAPIPHPYFLQTATGHVVMFGTFTECANGAIAYVPPDPLAREASTLVRDVLGTPYRSFGDAILLVLVSGPKTRGGILLYFAEGDQATTEKALDSMVKAGRVVFDGTYYQRREDVKP